MLPALGKNAGEEPDPQLTIECVDRAAAPVGAERLPCMNERLAIEIPRHTEQMRHRPEVERRALRRLHVEAGSAIQPRAADAAPVEPAPEIALVQARGGN